MNIDSLKYGKKSSYEKKFSTLPTPMFEKGWEKIKLPDPPRNSSKQTDNEIKLLQKLILQNDKRTLSDIKNQDQSDRPFELDYLKIIKQDNKKMKDWILDLTAQLFKICLHFKNKFDRPRPWQMAKALDIDFPDIGDSTQTGTTASYPSGHAFNSYFLALVLGEMYPKYKNELNNHAASVSLNRMRAGVHYPSDIESGKLLARKLYKYYKKPKEFNFKEWMSI